MRSIGLLVSVGSRSLFDTTHSVLEDFLQGWLSRCHGLDNAGAVPEPHYVVLPRFRGMAGPARVGETAQAGLMNDVN